MKIKKPSKFLVSKEFSIKIQGYLSLATGWVDMTEYELDAHKHNYNK